MNQPNSTTLAAAAAAVAAAATWNLNTAALRSFWTYSRRQGWTRKDPTAAIERHQLRGNPDRRVIPHRQARTGKRHSTDLTDAQWAELEGFLDPPRDPSRGGRPQQYPRHLFGGSRLGRCSP